LAVAARRQAVRSMSMQRWAHVLSLELGWMNPGQARSFVDAAVRAGLLAEDDGKLRLVIDPAAVEVPRGFRPAPVAAASPGPAQANDRSGPGPGPATAPPPDPFLAWVAKVAAQRGQTRDTVLAEVAAVQTQMGGLLTAEAAVLLLARRQGLDVAQAASSAEADLRAPYAKPKR
jgi:hypothetical protein